MKKIRQLIFISGILILFSGDGVFKTLTAEDKKEKESSKKEEESVHKGGKIIKTKRGKEFTADWRNTELNDFLKGMSAIIKKNILIDESLKGQKITIISQKTVPVKDAYPFMTSILETKGFGVIEEGNLIKVVKLKDALAKSPIVRIGREPIPDDELNKNNVITQIVPIYKSDLNELDALLKKITSSDTNIMVYKKSNYLVLSGTSYDINKLLLMIEKLDKGVEGPGATVSAGDTHIYTLEYNEAEEMAKVLIKLDVPTTEEFQTDKDKKPTPKNEKIKAVAHKNSNSIIINATNEEWAEISRIIKILDMPRKQILLEVLIVELSSTNSNSFGIDWRYKSNTKGYFQNNTGLAAQGGIIDDKGRITQVNTLSGFSLGFLKNGSEQILGILNANASNDNFNVLSAPQVLTLDNQEAEINVGQDVPVSTQARNAGLGGNNSVTVNSYDYRPTGIKLKFTPHINKNNKITLELDQEVKNIAGLSGNSPGQNPTFNKRNIKTWITVEDNQTVVIGGLINTDKQKTISKIPLLGDIPLLGSLFRTTNHKLVKTNMMVFLTPHILEDRGKADKMTIEKRNEQMIEEEEADRRTR
ncbi:MAG: type II secretion system protein GspD [Leptospiraceae bacterium]|nr:type II secretion system protein GspD [Leptospiraceae bacterium]MCP5493443.1 type II secretion system protein GspD [Leptospiraceae bacterium]